MAMTTSVRQATPQDTGLVAPLFDAYRQFYDLPRDPDAAQRYIADRLRIGDSTIFLSTDDAGAGLGFTQLYPALCSLSLKPYAILFDLFVAPAARRHGVGKQLLRRAHAYAVASGLDRLELQTARSNASAQALYESLGWTRDDTFMVYTWRAA
jgi:GNAT superfamily N-acetyltransferase